MALKGIFDLNNIYLLGSVEPGAIKELESKIDLDKTVFSLSANPGRQ